MISKAIEGVGESKVQQVDDRLEAVLGASSQGSIPKCPVVMTRFRLGQTPWCAVSDDLDTERGDRTEVVVCAGVVSALSELVLAIWNSLGEDQRIRPFFADGPGKDRECVLATNCAHDANLADLDCPTDCRTALAEVRRARSIPLRRGFRHVADEHDMNPCECVMRTMSGTVRTSRAVTTCAFRDGSGFRAVPCRR